MRPSPSRCVPLPASGSPRADVSSTRAVLPSSRRASRPQCGTRSPRCAPEPLYSSPKCAADPLLAPSTCRSPRRKVRSPFLGPSAPLSLADVLPQNSRCRSQHPSTLSLPSPRSSSSKLVRLVLVVRLRLRADPLFRSQSRSAETSNASPSTSIPLRRPLRSGADPLERRHAGRLTINADDVKVRLVEPSTRARRWS